MRNVTKAPTGRSGHRMRTQAHRIVDTDPKRGNVVVRLRVNDLQKMGVVAALIEAATFVVGFALYFTLLRTGSSVSGASAKQMQKGRLW